MSVAHGDLSPHEVALEAYLYYYPLVVMEATRQQLCANAMAKGVDLVGSPFIHNPKIANARWRSVARTNVDTLFSSCWLDMGNGPAEMTIPSADGRFFMYQVLDMWMDTYAVLGSRTLGDRATTVRFVPSTHPLDEISGLDRDSARVQIRTPTRFSWIIGRTNTSNEEADLVDARQHQAGVGVVYDSAPPMLHDVDPAMRGEAPVERVDAMGPERFFELADRLHRREGAHATDWSVLLRLSTLGLASAAPFVYERQSAEVQRSLATAFEAGREMTGSFASVTESVDGWQQLHSSIGVYGNDYLSRAIIARYGLAANPREDAVYISTSTDSSGRPLDGNHSYVVRFDAAMLPPAKFFWSITAYDQDGQLLDNRWNKYSVSSREALTFESDGSMQIRIGPILPPSVSEANWIPTNPTAITLTLRLYGPSADVLAGRWMPPPVRHELDVR